MQKGVLPFTLPGFRSICSKVTGFSLKLVLSSKLTLTGSLCRLVLVSLRSDASVTISQAEAAFLLAFPDLHRYLNRLDQYI